MIDNDVLTRMRKDWDKRARENAPHYIVNSSKEWKDRDFYRSGEINVANDIMPEMHRVCGGSRSPLDLTALEIGCGVGRMTKMLARIFGHVTALDVSKEMIDRARVNLADLHNVTLILGDGASLSAVPDESQDFAFSFIVFQHILTDVETRVDGDDVTNILRHQVVPRGVRPLLPRNTINHS